MPEAGDGTAGVTARSVVVWEHLQAALADQVTRTHAQRLDVLDLGGGSGGFAVPVARLGHRVTVVDPSPDALAALARRIGRGAGAPRPPAPELSIRAVQGDATDLGTVVPAASYDVLVCHGVLEHVDDVAVALRSVAGAVRPGGLVSVVVANRLAAVLARALGGHFADARRVLADPDGRWGPADPLRRRFLRAELVAALQAAGLHVEQVRGARVLGDLVPGSLVDAAPGSATELGELERALADHPGFLDIASALHVLARRHQPAPEGAG